MGWDAELKGIAIGPLGNGELLLGGSGHPVFINGADNNCSAVATGQLKHLEETLVPVLIVGGVEDAFAACHLEA